MQIKLLEQSHRAHVIKILLFLSSKLLILLLPNFVWWYVGNVLWKTALLCSRSTSQQRLKQPLIFVCVWCVLSSVLTLDKLPQQLVLASPFHFVALLSEIHRRRHQNVGRLLTKGDTALLLGYLWCSAVCFHIWHNYVEHHPLCPLLTTILALVSYGVRLIECPLQRADQYLIRTALGTEESRNTKTEVTAS